ncbi:unnamed protein product [Protopolystoma xenopodis]|uniref:Uncharacterized protein n=1 Tax=Protopolystoma xenopodis TaxID=117903 RepID=A0A448WQM1_9PLAT|nr:unnamed protein product [Protopolystoma xenopodis]
MDRSFDRIAKDAQNIRDDSFADSSRSTGQIGARGHLITGTSDLQTQIKKTGRSFPATTVSTVDERLTLLERRDEARRRVRITAANEAKFSCATTSPHEWNGLGACASDDWSFRRHANVDVVRGNCPDMCPETERYWREAKQRISVSVTHSPLSLIIPILSRLRSFFGRHSSQNDIYSSPS